LGLIQSYPLLVLVSGLPGTGKTTIAQGIAVHFSLPLFTKDSIKETLFDCLGTGDRPWSRRLSQATYGVMFHLAEALLSCGHSLVMEANFPPEITRPAVQNLAAEFAFETFEVNCVTVGEVLLGRFTTRGETGSRHPGHLDQIVFHEMEAMIAAGGDGVLNLDGGFLQVDTTNFQQVYPQRIFTAIDRFWRSI
jgi:predicted kinase